MSELIDNRKHRQETLKGIIRDLHAGAAVEDVKERFGELLDQVGAAEIADIEQTLINEGLPVEEVQRLCDVHVAVFKESLDKQLDAVVAKTEQMSHVAGALDPLKEENRNITRLVKETQEILAKISEATGSDIESLIAEWRDKHNELLKVDQHYSKKENILFPYLERYGISGPSSVMWGTHDEIRAQLKEVTQVINNAEGKPGGPQLAAEIGNLALPALNAISEMVYKEENILFPLCMETFTEDEWKEITLQLDDPMATTYRKRDTLASAALSGIGLQGVDLDVGVLTPEQINLVLTHLPIDITFVNEKDEVAYFSLGKERFFERTRAVIGRKVQFCHPPSSMGVVEQILQDFKSGLKDSAEFWINAKGTMLHIRYFAVRDKEGTYRGTLEVTQNITEIQKLTGEKRIYDYEQ